MTLGTLPQRRRAAEKGRFVRAPRDAGPTAGHSRLRVAQSSSVPSVSSVVEKGLQE